MTNADTNQSAELAKLQKSYELLGELSRDEMITIYVARDRLSGNEVTLKVLSAADAKGREGLAHYASDARLLTALEHPNIVAVYAVKWLSENVIAVVTERVQGPTLRQVLDVAGTLPVARATDVLRGIGRALAWAHSSQIMHRDVRPENIIFEDGTGRVVLSDFGLARRVEGANAAADASASAYRAPELGDGRYPDRRSDVYSLGVVGWEILTGRRPWPDDMEAVAGERAPNPPPLAEIRPGLPPALVAAIEGAVQLDRDRRISDVTTLMDRLTHVVPPPPEAEEDVEASLEGASWIAMPVPKLPRKAPKAAPKAPPARGGKEREVTPPVVAADVAPTAAPVDAAPSEPARGDQEAVERPVARGVEREADRDSAEASTKADRPAAPVTERAQSEMTAGAAPMSVPQQPTKASKRKRGRKEDSSAEAETSREVAPAEPVRPATTPPAETETDGGKESTRDTMSAAMPPVAGSEQSRPDMSRRRESAAGAAEASAALSASSALPAPPVRAEAAEAEEAAEVSKTAEGLAAEAPIADGGAENNARDLSTAPADIERPSMSAIPSDVELPPPEPVRFADLPEPPMRGPISTPPRGEESGPSRFSGMRGGLGGPRKGRARGRDIAPAEPRLQPIWDTPAEFPLPVTPDPRPVPADVGFGGRRADTLWTRRNIGIGAGVLLLLVLVVTLVQMQQAPDNTALLEPEMPTGYGGDVVLTPREDTAAAGDTTAPNGPAAGRAGEPARASASRRTAATTASNGGATTRDAAGREAPTREAATREGTTRSAATRDAATTRGSRAGRATNDAVRPTATGAATTGRRTNANEERTTANAPATGRCSSPALADQRACLLAIVDRNDTGLNSTYGAVIAAMRRRANSAPNDPDPPEVQRLRAAQRTWLVRRDTECRRRGRGREGRLWAEPRARCLATLSAERDRELAAMLARIRRD